jgi:hypothetical protein
LAGTADVVTVQSEFAQRAGFVVASAASVAKEAARTAVFTLPPLKRVTSVGFAGAERDKNRGHDEKVNEGDHDAQPRVRESERRG